MPRISRQKRDKISEQILAHLFHLAPQSTFTSQIASEIIRDEEFTKSLLQELKKQNLVVEINKSPSGLTYSRRQRWRLSDKAYQAYKNSQ